MITKSAIQHSANGADCYPYDLQTLHLRVRCAKGEVERVTLWIGDPYDWEIGGLNGGNLAGENAYNWTGGEKVEMNLEGVTQLHECWFASFIPSKKRARYCFILHGKDGREKVLYGERRTVDISDPAIEKKELSEIFNLFCFPYLHASDVLAAPAWVKDTVWYQIFPDRFANGRPETSPPAVMPWGTEPDQHNFMGGDLWGVIDKLDYLCDLGINGLYFTPVFTALSNHRYDTTDYFNVDPHLGGNEAFRALIQEAHARGMKVMLDAVFNHVGDQHPIWLDVVGNGEKSPYAGWFCINQFPVYSNTPRDQWDKWNLRYETFGTCFEMIKLDTSHPECRDYLLRIAHHWVAEFGVDAWRLDVANEVEHSFWRDFRKTVRQVNPECYILGEVWHDGMQWLLGDQFDALMNYPLSQSVIDYFGKRTVSREEFMQSVDRSYVSYPRNANEVMFNLLESHDTSRLMYLCGEDSRKARLAYLFMMTQAGSPCVYYGGEIGMSGGRVGVSEANRRCMVWEPEHQDLELHGFIRKIIRLRHSGDDLKSPVIQWLDVQQEDCIAYRRGHIEIVINNSDREIRVVAGGHEIVLPPFGYSIERRTDANCA